MPRIGICSFIVAIGCGSGEEVGTGDAGECPSDSGAPSSENYAVGVDVPCQSLAWAVSELLAEARAGWQPDAYLASASCAVEPETGLVNGNNCVGYFASSSVVGEHASCMFPAGPECEAAADLTDGYQPGDVVADWRVDSTVAVTLGLPPSTADAEMKVYPARQTAEWTNDDGSAISLGSTILSFPGDIAVNGVTGAGLTHVE